MILLATDTRVILEAAAWGFILAFAVAFVAWRISR